MSKLMIHYKGHYVACYEISTVETVIGRHRSCSIQLLSKDIHERHCAVTKVGTGFVLTDLSGRGATVVDGRRAVSENLLNGSTITLGDFTLTCELDLLESLVDVMLERLAEEGAARSAREMEGERRDGETGGCRVTWPDRHRVEVTPLGGEAIPPSKEEPALPAYTVWVVGVVLVVTVIVAWVLTR
ncbi:FHA domain-containing protein [bacterium]|nr:FHA domain-containing protein [candidate division CSSED10-310 bacterium]